MLFQQPHPYSQTVRSGRDERPTGIENTQQRIEIPRKRKTALQKKTCRRIHSKDFILHGKKARPALIAAQHNFRCARGTGGKYTKGGTGRRGPSRS